MGDDITQIFRKNLRAKMGGALAPPQRLGPGFCYRSKG